MGVSMEKPTECRWCGAAKSGEDGDDILFACGSWHSGSTPEFQYTQCELNVAQNRIRRSIDALKNATRYRVTPVSSGYVEWDTDEDGPVTDSAAVDEALAILEGERE